ncbi:MULTISPECIES: DUF998 domain-containing protein [Streptomyces]|uniref:DUF998 domain-containing protein n=2 Tax=Streptomyces TaxID=1883 RepID=UPI002FCA6656
MTATNTALAAGVRTPLALIGIGALAMAAVETLNPQYELVSETLSRYVHGTAGWLVPAALLAVGTASAILAVRLGAGTRRAGRAALAVWAAGILVAGFFPADPPGNGAALPCPSSSTATPPSSPSRPCRPPPYCSVGRSWPGGPACERP